MLDSGKKLNIVTFDNLFYSNLAAARKAAAAAARGNSSSAAAIFDDISASFYIPQNKQYPHNDTHHLPIRPKSSMSKFGGMGAGAFGQGHFKSMRSLDGDQTLVYPLY